MKIKTYSASFSIFFFSLLLFQLAIPNLSLASVSDGFRWRMALIRKFNAFRLAVGDRIFNEGLVGKEGWLFYTGDYSIHDYQKTSLMGPNRLKEMAEILTRLDLQTKRNGGRMWVVIPPDKNTIYPQYMPGEIPVIGDVSRLDQLTNYLRQNSEINLLDLRPLFKEVSQFDQIYYKADAHWNCLGAYYASSELLTQINALHPEVQVHPLTDYEFETTADSTLDIAGVMGLSLQEETVVLKPKFPVAPISHASDERRESLKIAVNSKTNLPKALVVHDSFYTECFSQFIEPQFSRVMSSHYEKAAFSDYMDWIESEQPDAVIIEFAERHIEYFFSLATRKGK
ncbi:MAG: hypothetical protein LDL51_04395 [Chloroflexi bacterium]|nr:hypothetical protein [Chloroflexota bacterium]